MPEVTRNGTEAAEADSVGDGMQQALDYAETLNIPFAFSSNGDGFVFHDRTGASTPRETNLPLVTTSRLLSTGVDIQTCRVIVLDRVVGSMTEFKQIVGRGTRVFSLRRRTCRRLAGQPARSNPTVSRVPVASA